MSTAALLTFGFAAALLTAFLGVALIRRFAAGWGLIDIPNARSSHRTPTATGGGLAIVGATLLSLTAIFCLTGYRISFGYLFGAAVVCSISFLDDLREIRPLIRLCFHLSAASVTVWWAVAAEGPYGHPIFNGETQVPWIVLAGMVLWIVFVTNAYNFMDGIDGIAALQAVIVGLSLAGIALTGLRVEVAILASAAAGAALGFLPHNWQPARIFMGDVGSAFLGFTFGSIPVLLIRIPREGSEFDPVIAGFLTWPFLLDSAITLVRRLLRREKVWRPHREHLYQRLVSAGWSHRKVAALYGASAVAASIGVVAASVWPRHAMSAAAWAAVASTLVVALPWVLSRNTLSADRAGSGEAG